jgi:DNA-binding response OmpR family regulator
MRILVVEDERGIADLIEKGLSAEGYSVTCARNGDDGEALALTGDFDLLLLDLMLPGKSGQELMRSVRAMTPELPVIMLTARSTVADKVEGLDLGADDYVTKPFAFEELLARVRAQLRRPSQHDPTKLRIGDLELDLRTREVSRSRRPVDLTAREFELLTYLMRHPGQVLSRSQILNAVWGYDHDPGTNVLEVYIGYLRRKLDRDGAPAPIETIRSAGYRLVDEND